QFWCLLIHNAHKIHLGGFAARTGHFGPEQPVTFVQIQRSFWPHYALMPSVLANSLWVRG
ncbi:MAG: hypothetical protein ACREKE_01945, partial [bacterium]